MTLPNFIIAGAARSGTTSLYYYLKQHPEIGFPDKKEPKYFSSISLKFPHNGPGDHTVDSLVIRDAESYQKLFQGLETCKCIGEASSDYLYYHKHTASKIKETLGDIPIILCLRNPAERAYSAYDNMLRDQRENLDFEQSLAAEKNRLKNNWDWMWAYQAGGLYANQVNTFLDTFTNVKIVLFDDLKSDSNTVIKDLFNFLGVDSNIAIDTKTRYGNSGTPKNKLIALLASRDNSLVYALRRIAFKVIPRSALERIASNSLAKIEVDPTIDDNLRAYFKPSIERLEILINKNLDAWK